MNSKPNPREEERVAELLRAQRTSPLPADEPFLARLRAESAEVFRRASKEIPESSSHAHDERGHGTDVHEDLRQLPKPLDTKRKSKMFLLAGRVLAITVVAVAAMVAWVTVDNSGEPTLAQVLEKTAAADSLHLKVVQSDEKQPQTWEVWSKNGGKLRINRADGTYDICQQEKRWQIDEKANRASAGDSPYYANKALDLLPLLDADDSLSPKIRKNLRTTAVRPVHEKIGDAEYDVYRYQTADEGRTVYVDARVNSATRLLHSLETLIDRDGRRTPVATLTVMNANQPVDENLFVVGDALTEDGRIGKITDAQGMVSVKPVMAERWTPVCGNILLKPGDWLQTELRGANAFAARLSSKSQIIAGPGALVELNDPKQIRLYSGDLKVSAEKDTPITLLSPGEEKIEVKEPGVYRVEKEKIVRLERDPKWLKGFEGSETQESIGSLVATVDGRNEPLTVGYHKVSVEIRDQIARTTVEESFVNRTSARLEGVFYFPLPQDASISGFGMWIGNELVEADIVEKQRAREIYEEILREKRDPGLLEWAGGNLFKARVFPIEANSEKRIRIIYTQVLPLTGNKFRYSYALQSELLKKHPLRELSIDVKLNSATPLKKISSPTHATRNAQTEHSGHVEFEAKEYTPTRDFEVVAELNGKQSEITMIPHRRGEDGYFLLLLAPKTPETSDDRDLLTGKQPLDVLLLADTSASLDEGQRAGQAEFIAAVLKSLTPKDTFNLACVDVGCDWVFEKSMPADEKNIETARQSLEHRVSLGWTDLPNAFSSAFERVGKNSRVIYVGDGIPTTTDAEPAAVSANLRRIYDETCRDKGVACYTVSVGSTFESGVLKTIASLGGGSMRQITGEQPAKVVALDLLKEITRPALTGAKVQFGGLRVARVYPEELPNLPAGSQQIVLGRYLPQGDEQKGEIVVTGRLGEKEVKFEQSVVLKNNEEGNSFIPRLWARMHLDRLLQQGASAEVKEDIIALSEEYHIITPYTSLLVLESDADRERFKVKRGFQMRDGEKFFAEGRENANFELIQQQMKRAGGWRVGLCNSVLQQLSGLGRDANGIPRAPVARRTEAVYETSYGLSRLSDDYGREFAAEGRESLEFDAGRVELNWHNSNVQSESLGDQFMQHNELNYLGVATVRGVTGLTKRLSAKFEEERQLELGNVKQEILQREVFFDSTEARRNLTELSLANVPHLVAGDWESADGLHYSAGADGAAKYSYGGRTRFLSYTSSRLGQVPETCFSVCKPTWERRPAQDTMLNTLFGVLPSPSEVKKTIATDKEIPEEVLSLSNALRRMPQISLADGGLKIEVRCDNFDPRFGTMNGQSGFMLVSNAQSWLVLARSGNNQSTLQWCNGGERGIVQRAFQLGRLRKSVVEDMKSPPVALQGFLLSSLADVRPGQKASVLHPAEDRAMVVFEDPNDRMATVTQVLIDTKRNVVLSVEMLNDGKTTSKQTFSDFVEVAGAWWAGKCESFDEKGRLISTAKQKIERLDGDQFAQTMRESLAEREQIQFLRDPGRKLIEAKRAIKEGKADFDDRIALLMNFVRSGQWVRAKEHLDAAEQLAAGKKGMRWLRYEMLKCSRRNEELKTSIGQEAAALCTAKHGIDDQFLANHLLGCAGSVVESNELLSILDTLEPVFDRQPEWQHWIGDWKRRKADILANLGRGDESLALYRELAEAYPRDFGMQIAYVQKLNGICEYEMMRTWIDRLLASDTPWVNSELDPMHSYYLQSLREQERFDELIGSLARFLERRSENPDLHREYLDVLFILDRIDEAYALVERWFREGRKDNASATEYARLQGAIEWVFCQNNHFCTNQPIQKIWLEQLAETAMFFARDNARWSNADQIFGNWQFHQTEYFRKTREKLAKMFADEFDSLSIAKANWLIRWLSNDEAIVTREKWREYAHRVIARYEDEANPFKKNELAQLAMTLLSCGSEPGESTEFLRRLTKEMSEKYRYGYISRLFGTLQGEPWSEKTENELFGLLDQIAGDQPAEVQITERVRLLLQLNDRMLGIRLEAKNKAIPHPETLTRVELEAKQTENLRKTREEYADRLMREIPKHEGVLGTWIEAESVYLDVMINRNLAEAADFCWKTLDAESPVLDENADEAANVRVLLDETLRNRSLTTLMNLASRKEATKASIERLMTYFDRQIAKELDRQTENQQWKLLKYEMLIVLDRPQELEKTLGEWIKSGDADNRWRIALGYVLAEQGKLADAVAALEAIAASNELGSAEYETLSTWQQALGRREDYEKSRLAVYKTMAEGEIDQRLRAWLQPWISNSGPKPSSVDASVIVAFQTLFAKSAQPQNYLNYHLRHFYGASRDFRLLACLADSVIGQTSGNIYPFLSASKSTIDEIRDEASVDSFVERIAQLRKERQTAVDLRALDLLEAMVERRASELTNQPGSHVEKAIAALRRAFEHPWSPGEQKMMAGFLDSLGVIPQRQLAAEQMRQLTAIYEGSAPDTRQRLEMACIVAGKHWNYNQRQAALDLLEAEVNRYPAARHVDSLAGQPIFTTFISYLENSGQFAEAVERVKKQFALETKTRTRNHLKARIVEIMTGALRQHAVVGDLQSETLYRETQKRILGELPSGDTDYDNRLITLLDSLYRVAYEQGIASASADLKVFAYKTLPPLLKKYVKHHEENINRISGCVYVVCGPGEAIAFLFDRGDHDPHWLGLRRNFWIGHLGEMNVWRKEAKNLDPRIADRLLSMILGLLREGLQNGNYGYLYVCDKRMPLQYWSEREADFLRVAEEVYARNRKDGRIVAIVADYIESKLDRTERAIELLQAAERDRLLDEGARSNLVRLLHNQGRYGESIGVLQSLVEKSTDNLSYRRLLMRAYFRTNRKKDLLALLAQTDEYFHQKERWGESPLEMLAASCLENQLYEQAAGYYKELIPLHERTAPNRGIGDGTLSSYYANQARTYANMKKTVEAVEAAFAAVVAWGPHVENRANALQSMKDVLNECEDLDAYAAELDAQAEKTGLHNPLIRKTLGQVYAGRGQCDKAVVQLHLAAKLQANDREIRNALVDCCDKLGDKQGAIRELIATAQLARRDIELYKNLGNRLADLHDDREAERAFTTIVEVLASESESHAMLAEIREGQNRWAEAIDQWRQVSKIRAIEPTGLLRLAAAQIHEKLWTDAVETLKQLRAKTWPPQFAEVGKEIGELESQLLRVK
jgi:tetratricopeptide (TPR) repeat protein/Mg-chelatase subunit ChlD/outer membrane lipoprotein-sorting protein